MEIKDHLIGVTAGVIGTTTDMVIETGMKGIDKEGTLTASHQRLKIMDGENNSMCGY